VLAGANKHHLFRCTYSEFLAISVMELSVESGKICLPTEIFCAFFDEYSSQIFG
jgi:hypothetical protein